MKIYEVTNYKLSHNQITINYNNEDGFNESGITDLEDEGCNKIEDNYYIDSIEVNEKEDGIEEWSLIGKK